MLWAAVLCIVLLWIPQVGQSQQLPSAKARCETALSSDSVVSGPVSACELALRRAPQDFNTRYYYFQALKRAGRTEDALSLMETVLRVSRDSVGRIGQAMKLVNEVSGPAYTLARLQEAFPPERDSTEAMALFVYALADTLPEQLLPTIDSVLRQTPQSQTALVAILRVLWYRDRTSQKAKAALTELRRMNFHSDHEQALFQFIADELADSAKSRSDSLAADTLRVWARQQHLAIIPPSARVGTGDNSFSQLLFDSYKAAKELDSLAHYAEAQAIARRAIAQPMLTQDDLRHGAGLALVLDRPYLGAMPSLATENLRRLVGSQLAGASPLRTANLLDALLMSDLVFTPVDVRVSFWRWLADTGRTVAIRATASVRIADALIEAKRSEEASRVAWRAITLAPPYAHAWWVYGAALYNTAQYAKAVGAWERALLLNPELFDMYGDSKAWEYVISVAGRQPPTPLPRPPTH